MTLEPLAPDAGEVLRLWLNGVPEVTSLTSDRIGLTLTGPSVAIRYALVDGANLGGGAAWAKYQVECWGQGAGAVDDGTANRLALRVMAAAPSLVGAIGTAWVTGCSAAYPYSANDETSGRPRTIVELTFALRPA